MSSIRPIICLTLAAVVSSCMHSREGPPEPAADAAAGQAASATDQRSQYLIRAAETHVIVVDGERIPREERVATVRELDMDDLESITLHGAGDPRGRELIGDEEAVVGAIVLVMSEREAGGGSDGVRGVSAPQTTRDGTVYPVRRITDRLRAAPWVMAGDDAEGDGRRAGFQDGRALWYWLDAESDTLWVRLGVYGEIDEELPAVSLSFDLDDDQETGIAWYGSNTAFQFDKMVSVGPVRREGDDFVGYNGITDADGVRRRDWINERQGNVAFMLDPADRSYIVGVALEDLAPAAPRVDFIGSVGHRATWNDDLIDEGYVTITLP